MSYRVLNNTNGTLSGEFETELDAYWGARAYGWRDYTVSKVDGKRLIRICVVNIDELEEKERASPVIRYKPWLAVD